MMHIPIMNSSKQIVISGAGLVGTLLSILLAKRGHTIHLIEKRNDPRTASIIEGRSINLALSHRGIQALKKAGLDQTILEGAVPMYGRHIHPLEGTSFFQPYGEKHQCIYSISRNGLNCALLEAASLEPNIQLHFGEKAHIESIYDSYQLVSESIVTSEKSIYTADLIASCDGAFSVVRQKLVEDGGCQASLDKLEHGYLELDIPAELGKNLEPNALHIWPRQYFMLIALPNRDGTFTGTLFLPFEGKNSFQSIQTDHDIEHFFRTWFPDAEPLISNLISQFRRVPPSFLATVHTFPWKHKNVLLLGDAAHAIVPFYGQGMNAGFEDVRILDDLLEHMPFELALEECQRVRKPNADAIAELALQNFVEMRDLVDDPDFQLQKKIEARLHKEIPEYLPQYSQVTFSDIPYAEALENGKRHQTIIQEILTIDQIHERWNTPEIWSVILEKFQKEIS